MKNSGAVLLLFVCVIIFSVALKNISTDIFTQTSNFTASVFFKDSVTEQSLKKDFKIAQNDGPRKTKTNVRILIVPGHDMSSPGTAFGGLKEVDLNIDLAEKLYRLLKTETNFDVFLTQTKSGYTPEFMKYFVENWDAILKFNEAHKGDMERFINEGRVDQVVNVEHNTAPSDVALRLFGINKWANENNVDIVIHIHFNDYPGRRRDYEPKYSGFAIYVPESQYSNAKGSKSVAESVFDRLSKLYSKSNLPIEAKGIVEDQELIAIGSNNTLDGAAMLIEYGYIYEPIFSDPNLRDVTLSDLALQTFLGILDFFDQDPSPSLAGKYETRYLPYEWSENLEKGEKNNPDVLRLQAALTLEGVYPPTGEDKKDCPLVGSFGKCTEESVKIFQEKYEINPAEGFVGEKTREKLNEVFGK